MAKNVEPLSTDQELALIEETQTAIFIVQEGLIALNRLSAANIFYHGPLLLLAQGFERLMKIIVCLGQLEQTGSLPRPGVMRKFGHDLPSLKDAIIDLCEATGYGVSSEAAKADLAYMDKDPSLAELILLLGAFGEEERYYNLDALLESPAKMARRADPDAEFDAIKRHVLDAHPVWKEKMGISEFNGFYSVLNADLTTTLQRFARALCRMFALGPLQGSGTRVEPIVRIFSSLRDEELGTVPPRWYEHPAGAR